MSPSTLDSCRAAEARIRQVQQLLLDPGKLDLCRGELGEVIATLEPLAADSRTWSEAETAVFRQIKRSVRKLRAQIDYASNLWQGLLQMRLGTGYTEQGLPILANREAQTSFEG